MSLVYTHDMVNIQTQTDQESGDFSIAVMRGMSLNGGHGVGAQCNPYDGIVQQEQEEDLMSMGLAIAEAVFKYKDKYGIK